MDTVSDLPFNGSDTPSQRNKTNSAAKISVCKVLGRGVFLCSIGLGVFKEDSRRPKLNSSSGGLPTSRNWFGNSRWLPMTALAGKRPYSTGTAVLIPSITQGR